MSQMAETQDEENVDMEKVVHHIKYKQTRYLGHRVVPGCVISTVIEPKGEEKIAAVTISNKVQIHDSEYSLNMRDKVRCITAAPFGKRYNFIVVGTESQVMMFDVYNNITVFQRDLPDGVNCFAVGKLADRDIAIYCGGNCAIWGFDQEGKDVYWTVTGDVVTTMCLCDYDQDKENELIIGSPDHEIRVFKDDLMRKEIMETDAVLKVADVGNNCFAYALANGTLGLYKKDERMWRIKSKHVVIELLSFPFVEGIFTAIWDSGKKDIRSLEDGEQVASVTVGTAGTRNDTGIVAAFLHNAKDGLELTTTTPDGTFDAFQIEDRTERIDKTQEALREYGQQKHNLLMELSNFEAEEQMKETDKRKELRIPANTVVDASLEVNVQERLLNIRVHASNDVCIRGVVAFAEGMFEGDSYIWIPQVFQGYGNIMHLPILTEKNNENEISLRVLLGRMESDRLFVFENSVTIPKFCRYLWIKEHPEFKQPESYVEVTIKFRPQRVIDWIMENFCVAPEQVPEINKDAMEIDFLFLELAPKKELSVVIRMDISHDKLFIYCECIQTAGEILQSLMFFMSISTLSSIANFPKTFQEVEDIVKEMDDMYDVESRLTADVSSHATQVKEILVRAEDAMAMEDYENGKKLYLRLKLANDAMMQASRQKCTHHEKLVATMRKLNKIIEFASKLRVGTPSRDIVASCRDAIKDENKGIIVKILQYGARTES